jgi:hypothetical protein
MNILILQDLLACTMLEKYIPAVLTYLDDRCNNPIGNDSILRDTSGI